METDLERLHELNILIGEAESRGDQAFFQDLLSPAFAMRRANGAIQDRTAFLQNVAASLPRTTRIQSLTILGTDRAMVTCTVEMGEKQFENLRVFVRESGEIPWTLLAWANEPVTRA
jgi:hypothetical protein